jgi:hypothetical protein
MFFESLSTYNEVQIVLLRLVCYVLFFAILGNFCILFHWMWKRYDMVIAAPLTFFAHVKVLHFVDIDGSNLFHPTTEHSQIAQVPFIKLCGVILSSFKVFICFDTVGLIIFQCVAFENLDAMKHCSEFVFHFRNSDRKCRLPQIVHASVCFEMIENFVKKS